MFFRRDQGNTPPVLTDMQKQYETETGSTMFSKPPSGSNFRTRLIEGIKNKEAYEKWSKATAGMDAGKNRFNAMMANRSQNPVSGQTQAGMSGFDKFQAMQAARNDSTKSYNDRLLDGMNKDFGMGGHLHRLNDQGKLFKNTAANQQPGYDKFQAMQAARDSANYNVDGSSLPAGVVSWADLENGSLENKIRAYNTGQRSEQAARFNAAMGANPLILQQLQMGQRQMGPQFNAFGFGAQPGLSAQGGQGGSMLANMSSQGMNQLAAGQQNNPTIFKAKS